MLWNTPDEKRKFYWESLIDLFQYLSFLLKKAWKFQMLLYIVGIIYYFLKTIYSDDKQLLDTVNGVIISIIAALLFEGYRSYKKNIIEKNIIKRCIFYFFSNIKSFSFQYHILDTEFLDVAHYSGYKQNPVDFHMTIIEKLEITKKVFEQFDRLHETDPKKINDQFFCVGIDGYKSFKTALKEATLTLNKNIDVVNMHCEDDILIEKIHNIYNMSSSIINDQRYPDCLRNGNVLLVFPPLIFFIYALLDFFEYSKNYISEDEYNKLISFR